MNPTMAALLLAQTLGSAAPEDSGQFNLNCSGVLRTLAPALLRDSTEAYSTTYRIDLGAKKWCEGECTTQRDFGSVTPVAIILEDRKTDTPREHEELRNRISRETGEHSVMAESGVGRMRIAMFWKGRCEKAPFTGFPSVATKF